MSSLNKVSLIGHVGKAPEIRATQSGKEIASFSIACSEYYRDKQTGEKKSKTEWIPIVVFSDVLVGIIKQYVKKGSKLYIEGSLATRKWKDKDDVERYITEVVLQGFGGKIILLDGKEDSEPTAHQKAKQDAYVDDIDDEVLF